ncbi:MAG: BACON domain-containing carbohydrate-binding protein, partial [Rikenellaceae bacterium]
QTSGEGNVAITVSYSANSEYDSRSASFNFEIEGTTQSFTITQAGETFIPTLSLSKTSQTVESTSGSLTLNVTSNTSWIVTDIPSWITLSQTSGEGDVAITVSYGENSDYSSRTGSFTFSYDNSSVSVTVTQEGKEFIPTLSIDKTTQSVTATAGSFSLNLTSNTSWSATNNSSWITLSKTSGEGDAAITVSYSENSEYTSRSETLTFNYDNSSVSVTITQEAKEFIPTLSISKTSQSVSSSAGGFLLSVTSNTSWSATDLPSWITLSQTSGDGDATITVSYSANSEFTARSATFNFETESLSSSITLTQEGKEPLETEVTFGVTTSQFSSGDEIAVTSYDSQTGLTIGAGVKYTYASGTFSSTTPIEFDPYDESQKLIHYALYPYSASESTSFSFSVNSDQSTQANYKTSDLLSSSLSATDSRNPSFTFYRRLSSVQFSLTSSEVDLTNATVTVYAQNSVDCNIKTNSYVASGDAVAIKALANSDGTYSVILPPQTIASGSKFIVVSVGSNNYTLTTSSSTSFTSGTESSYTLNITRSSISFSGDINP